MIKMIILQLVSTPALTVRTVLDVGVQRNVFLVQNKDVHRPAFHHKQIKLFLVQNSVFHVTSQFILLQAFLLIYWRKLSVPFQIFKIIPQLCVLPRLHASKRCCLISFRILMCMWLFNVLTLLLLVKRKLMPLLYPKLMPSMRQEWFLYWNLQH